LALVLATIWTITDLTSYSHVILMLPRRQKIVRIIQLVTMSCSRETAIV